MTKPRRTALDELLAAARAFLRMEITSRPSPPWGTYECGEGFSWKAKCPCLWHRRFNRLRAAIKAGRRGGKR
jgi:hypothetical protein